VEALVGEKLDITADDLDQVRLETMREAKAEAL
jgi:hypothetical protein